MSTGEMAAQVLRMGSAPGYDYLPSTPQTFPHIPGLPTSQPGMEYHATGMSDESNGSINVAYVIEKWNNEFQKDLGLGQMAYANKSPGYSNSNGKNQARNIINLAQLNAIFRDAYNMSIQKVKLQDIYSESYDVEPLFMSQKPSEMMVGAQNRYAGRLPNYRAGLMDESVFEGMSAEDRETYRRGMEEMFSSMDTNMRIAETHRKVRSVNTQSVHSYANMYEILNMWNFIGVISNTNDDTRDVNMVVARRARNDNRVVNMVVARRARMSNVVATADKLRNGIQFGQILRRRKLSSGEYGQFEMVLYYSEDGVPTMAERHYKDEAGLDCWGDFKRLGYIDYVDTAEASDFRIMEAVGNATNLKDALNALPTLGFLQVQLAHVRK